MTIQKTSDYNIFKKHPNNRDLDETNVARIYRSIKIKNLLPFRPILVDEEMRVMDGQHRLEAARRLEEPVYYEVKKDLKKSDIILLQAAAPWRKHNYLSYWVAEGNPEYIKLKDFMKENGLDLQMASAVLGIKVGGKTKGGPEFMEGKFKFPAKIEEETSLKILKETAQIVEFIDGKTTGSKRYIKGPKFRRALFVFLSIKVVDFETFMDKLSYRLDLVRPCAGIKDFVAIFKMIYNFRNRNPITMDEYEG